MLESLPLKEYLAQAERLYGKPKRKGKTPESSVLTSCLDWLKTHGVPAWRNNTGSYETKDRYGNPRYIAYGAVGSGDITGIVAKGKYRGFYLNIECKAGKGKQSDNQVAWQRMVEQAGGIYILAYSVEQLEERKQDIAP